MNISIVIPSKNDYKVTTLNECLYKMSDLEVELLVVDWGSDTPIDLPSFVKSVVVQKSIADKYNKDSKFALNIAANVGLRRASGDYIFYMGNDTFCTKILIDYVSRECVDNIFYVIPRRHIKSIETMDQFKQSGVSRHWGASGAWVAHRSIWHTLKGFDERWIYYGFMDREIVWRSQMKGYGIKILPPELSVYHVDHPRCWMRANGVENEKIYTQAELKPTTWIANDDGWGLGSEING